MRIALHTLGTLGDVQPYVALALGLKEAGHEVLVAAPTQFEAFVASRGIAFAHLPGEFLELMETPEARAALSNGQGVSGGYKLVKKFRPIVRKQLTAEWQAARRFVPELIIYHPKALAVPHIGERLRCPTVLASPLPGFTPTREFASPLLPFASVGPLNRLSHRLMAHGGGLMFGSIIAEWRVTELELPKRPRRPLRPVATLYAYSSHVVPRPADWPDDVSVTGYWFLDEQRTWKPDSELVQFIAGGSPPVYIGFGSMPGLDPDKLSALVTETLVRGGVRAVLATGGGALSRNANTAYTHFIDAAPHEALFPLMAACVHHGGAGTTAASLRAGKPTVICPFFGDQSFWARRVHALGAGPPPLDRKALNSGSLLIALQKATTDVTIRFSAMALGDAIRRDAGVQSAIEFLNQRIIGGRRAPSQVVAAHQGGVG